MSDLFEQFVVILHHPRDVRNIGAAVRALHNMGFGQLRLVAPVAYTRDDLRGIAHRSEAIIDQIVVYDELATALADLAWVVATSARTHRERAPRHDLDRLVAELAARAGHGRVGLLFGPEDNGLDSAALDLCDELLSLPVNPAYPSLNLAQAVLLTLYEVRRGLHSAPPARPLPSAERGQIAVAMELLEGLIAQSDFIKSGDGSQQRRTLRALLAKASPSEIAMLSALLRETNKRG